METEQVNMVLTAEDRASAAIRNLMGEMQALKRLAQSFGSGLKKGISGLDFGTTDLGNFRKTQDGIMRGLRQRGQEEKTQDRTRTAGAREQIRLDRYRMSLRMRHERELGLEMRRLSARPARLEAAGFTGGDGRQAECRLSGNNPMTVSRPVRTFGPLMSKDRLCKQLSWRCRGNYQR
ncbi:UNVERIFIED_CONTAM: hypothetical protein Q9R58_07785 [Methylobacteriaceae bacterium AG10]|nr:hypothetical protein [Methylobacteriaceae bacterium AG10]